MNDGSHRHAQRFITAAWCEEGQEKRLAAAHSLKHLVLVQKVQQIIDQQLFPDQVVFKHTCGDRGSKDSL